MSGRYIDADAFEKDLQDWYKLFTWDDGGAEKATIARAIQTLSDHPTADVREVVHGEWKECEIVQEHLDEPIIDEWQSARCSVCGKYHTTPYMYYFDHFNYCPNCGAKMDTKGETDEQSV